jgi:putative peptidoglycan lipid II flippase
MDANMSRADPRETAQTVSRSSLAFLVGTFLSRLTGLGRDTAMAIAFGSHPAIAAFMVAFRFANLIRRLFGEGSLSSGFIPYFEQMSSISLEKGAKFARDLLFSLSLFLLLLIGVVEIVLWGVWKWGNLHPDNAQILYLTILMLPGALFICLFGLSSSLLQCERRFFLTGFAPVAFNGVWIAATWMLKGRDPSLAVLLLSLAIIVAFFMQWALLMPQTFALLKRSLSWKECVTPQLFSSQLRLIVKPFFLGIIGVGAVQINSALDGIFARSASLQGPAYLWYAIRIEQLPLALFGIALSAALLPSLSRALKEGMHDSYLRLLRFAFRRSFSLIFPCVLGIFVLGVAGINFLYGHGDFNAEDTFQTVICLWGYGFGLVPSVFILMLAPAFYAKKEFWIPTIGSLSSVILHLLLTSVFVFGLKWGAFSIAVVTSIAAWFNYFYLAYHLTQRIGEPLLDASVFKSFLKTTTCTLIAAVATLLVGHFLVGDPTVKIASGSIGFTFSRGMSKQCLQLLTLSGTYILIFFSYAWMMNAEDILELIGMKRKGFILDSTE